MTRILTTGQIFAAEKLAQLGRGVLAAQTGAGGRPVLAAAAVELALRAQRRIVVVDALPAQAQWPSRQDLLVVTPQRVVRYPTLLLDPGKVIVLPMLEMPSSTSRIYGLYRQIVDDPDRYPHVLGYVHASAGASWLPLGGGGDLVRALAQFETRAVNGRPVPHAPALVQL